MRPTAGAIFEDADPVELHQIKQACDPDYNQVANTVSCKQQTPMTAAKDESDSSLMLTSEPTASDTAQTKPATPRQ